MVQDLTLPVKYDKPFYLSLTRRDRLAIGVWEGSSSQGVSHDHAKVCIDISLLCVVVLGHLLYVEPMTLPQASPRLLGFVTMRITQSQSWRCFRESRTGYIMTIGVRPEVQRSGLGRLLMLVALDRLQAAGCSTIELHVHTTNIAARRMYSVSLFHPIATGCHSQVCAMAQRLGFLMVDVLVGYYFFHGKQHDAYHLRLEIDRQRGPESSLVVRLLRHICAAIVFPCRRVWTAVRYYLRRQDRAVPTTPVRGLRGPTGLMRKYEMLSTVGEEEKEGEDDHSCTVSVRRVGHGSIETLVEKWGAGVPDRALGLNLPLRIPASVLSMLSKGGQSDEVHRQR